MMSSMWMDGPILTCFHTSQSCHGGGRQTGGTVDGNAMPVRYEIDYVRIYQK
ncbi:MAG: hypothetical protein RR386_08145 [Bacteroidaceae bacterium]